MSTIQRGVKKRSVTEGIHDHTVGINPWLEKDEIEILINDDGTIEINVNTHSECFADTYLQLDRKRRVVMLRNISIGNIERESTMD